MDSKKIRTVIEKRLSGLVLAILVIQPMLDVLSYFLSELGSNSISTLLRFAILAAVALLGFVVSGKKKVYLIFYGVMAGYWILHAANCFRVGYTSFVADTANFLRIMSFPIFVLSFITFFEHGKKVRRAICTGFAVNFLEVVLFTALPWALRRPVYTYEELEVGVMGWFGVSNAQSAIIVLIVPLALFFAYRTKKYWAYLASAVLCFGLMFLTGTKFTFYSIFIIAGALMFLFVLNLKKGSIRYVAPLLAVLVLAVALKPYSPMQRRETMSAHARGVYEERVEESLESSGTDQELIQSVKEGNIQSISSDDEKLAKLRRSLMGVYTDPDIYGPFLGNLHQRFGVYNVMAAYDYTTEPTILSDSRVRKATFAKLVWEEKDLPTKLLGFEYSDMLMGEATYDLENDFPAVFYFCGYLGFAIYLLFCLYFVFVIIRALVADIRRELPQKRAEKRLRQVKGTGKALLSGFQRFMTIETGVVGMTFLLAVIAAQISGNVLRRPNVTPYFAVAAAYLYELCRRPKPSDEEEF